MGTVVQRGRAWRAIVRRQGVARSGTFDTKAEAEVWVAKIESGIRDERPGVAKVRGITVAALFARYAKEISPKKRGCRWELLRLAALGRSPAFDVAAVSMDGAALAEWRDRRLREVSAATVNRELNIVSAVFSHSIMEWRIPLPQNPVSKMRRPAQPKGRTRRVSNAERDAICQHVGWEPTRAPVTLQEWTAWAFCLALETAMRQGEILSLTWANVRARSVHLPMTKNGYPRDVPLSSAARALIEILERGKPAERVTPLTSGTCGPYFRRAARGASLVDLHFHDSRHEAVTRLAARMSIMDLARVSGHRDSKQLLNYYHPTADDLSDLLD
jgi:integrase